MIILKRYQLVVALAICLLGSWVFAQDLRVTGQVLSEDTGEPLAGAEVQLEGTFTGSTTDADGLFILSAKGVSSGTLLVQYIGFKPRRVDVSGSEENLRIMLAEDILKGSEVVVTGLASSVKRQNLANSVASLSAEELLPAPTQSTEMALAGKFAGVNVSQNTGAPGGGISVTLRGTSTIEGRTQPLYVIDGVIVDNTATQSGIDVISAATGAGSPRPQGQPVNRFADIPPWDIANLEVLKGASAGAIYGAKASNGVVIITTKSGQSGRTSVDVQQQLGVSSIVNKLGTRRFNSAADAEAQYGTDGRTYFEQNGGRFIDQEDVLYGNKGLASITTLSARGGSGGTTFYLSGAAQDETGIVENSGYQRLSGRANIGHRFNDRLRVNLSTTVLRTESDRGMTGNDNSGRTYGFALAATPSFIDLERSSNFNIGASGYPVNPFVGSNPVETRDLFVNNERVYRTINSALLNLNLFRNDKQNLDFGLQAGFDFYSQFNQVVSPANLQFELAEASPGASIDGETRSVNSNFYYNLSHLFNSGGKLFKTSVGLQFENANLNNTLVIARGIPVGEVNVDQGSSVEVLQTQQKQFDRGFYAQEEIDLSGKIYLTAGVRGDLSSSNGDTEKMNLYPKAAASVRLSQYGFWDALQGFSDEFKLRVAYGETGNTPAPGAKFTDLNAVSISGNGGFVTATRRGNPDIKPERTREIEVGFDASLLGGRSFVEFSYYTQNITDLILTPDLAPSSGFTEEIINGGEMTTNGIEVALGGSLIKSAKARWDARMSFFKTKSEITSLAVDPFNLGGFATFLGTYRIEEGRSPTAIVGSERTAGGDFIEIGNETPDFEIGLHNRLSYTSFELSFLWHWKKGGDVINLGRLITDLGGTSPDWDTGAPTERVNQLGTVTAPYVEDGSYFKLREATLNWNVSKDFVSRLSGGQVSYLRLGLTGRNLITITDYTGYDPEVSQFGSVAIGRSVDTIPFPSARSYYFNISFGL